MIEIASTEINVDALMQRVREEVERRKMLRVYPQTSATAVSTPAKLGEEMLPPYDRIAITLPRSPESGSCIEQKPEYTLADFYRYHGEDFIRNAYRGILRREPDIGGNTHYLHMLLAGRLSKVEILGALRYSSEGKACAVPVQGLLRPLVLRLIYRIPILGYCVAVAKIILRLPVIIRDREQLESQVFLQQRDQMRHLNSLAERSEGVIDSLQQRLAARDAQVVHYMTKLMVAKAGTEQLEVLASETGERIDSLIQLLETKADKADTDSLVAAATHLQEQMVLKAGMVQVEALAAQTDERFLSVTKAVETKAANEHLTQLTNELAATATSFGENLAQKADAATTQREIREIQRQMQDHKNNILDQHRRLALLLEEARKRLPELISVEQIENMVAEEDHLLDAFYVSFEDRFRGTREDIKQRVAIYLPIVEKAGAGQKNAPILDVGCGRGEWLQLLAEKDLVARGVDLNRVMVSQCQELGLEVVQANAIDYLRRQKANSLGAVTGMHIIEHIPFKRLIPLFDEVLRVLKPGGVAIFETPNPENLIVGACNFYYDPTHLNPLPPEPMRFVMEARGFARIEIMRLHPYPESALLTEGSAQVKQMVNSLMFGAQDYSLVAYKS